MGLHFSSITVVARDWKVNMVFAFSRKVNAKAIVWAGQLAISHGFSAVIIESDCRECIQAVFKVRSCSWQI